MIRSRICIGQVEVMRAIYAYKALHVSCCNGGVRRGGGGGGGGVATRF